MVDRFRAYDRIVEVGIGHATTVAAALAHHAQVTATDITDRSVPDRVRFVIDDVTAPDPRIYAGVDLVYGLNVPRELHRPLAALATAHDLDCAVTTFATEGCAVPAEPEQVGGDSLYWIRRSA